MQNKSCQNFMYTSYNDCCQSTMQNKSCTNFVYTSNNDSCQSNTQNKSCQNFVNISIKIEILIKQFSQKR